ncbi:hypothetical protein PV326_004275 [Microctonus aethiopoides]|nr:hypothetical protein PV326_004275 [Microctonus aethiopoides]
MDICLAANYTKPGNCPGENPMSPFEAACVTACNSDSQCTDVAKCCSNNCGITCMRPLGLEKWEDLPHVPDKIEIRREKSNMVALNWNIRKNSKYQKFVIEDWTKYDQSVMYLVEERHVLGPRYLESRLSPWRIHQVTNKNYLSIRVGLKTGHWYQFRVAAVNEIGSRGYSPPSSPFKTADHYFSRELHEKSGVRIWGMEVGK